MPKNQVGRPPKYSEPSKPVTVTLPERILHKLCWVDKDRGRAITKAVDMIYPDQSRARPAIEVIDMGDGLGLIVVGQSKVLSRIPGLKLIEIFPMRYIISIKAGTSVDTVELSIMDLVEHLPDNESEEIRLLQSLRRTLKRVRHNEGVTKAEILFVAMEQS